MEFWAIIDGFEDYQVSTEGRVRRCRRAASSKARTYVGRILKQQVIAGYLYVGLKIDKLHYLRVNRLVGKTFLPNPNGLPEVNHLDPNDRHNNGVGNLEWTTHQGNLDHAVAHGRGLNKTHCDARHIHGEGERFVIRICGKRYGTFATYAEAEVRRNEILTSEYNAPALTKAKLEQKQ